MERLQLVPMANVQVMSLRRVQGAPCGLRCRPM